MNCCRPHRDGMGSLLALTRMTSNPPNDGLPWTPGPPPEKDDEALAIVIMKPETQDTTLPVEHYGQPAIVHRWSTKLKTTVNPTRLAYEDVLCWMPWPPPTA